MNKKVIIALAALAAAGVTVAAVVRRKSFGHSYFR